MVLRRGILSNTHLSAAKEAKTMHWGDARRTFESMMWPIRGGDGMQPSKKSTGTVVSDLGSRDDHPSGWSRREFVGGLAALSAGQTLFGAALAGEAGNPR